MLVYGWEPLTVSYHPAKYGDHRHCGVKDFMFLGVKEQDYTCPLTEFGHYHVSLTHIAYHVYMHEIPQYTEP